MNAPSFELLETEDLPKWIEMIEHDFKNSELQGHLDGTASIQDLDQSSLKEFHRKESDARKYLVDSISENLEAKLKKTGWTTTSSATETFAQIMDLVFPEPAYLRKMAEFLQVKREDYYTVEEFIHQLRRDWDLIKCREPAISDTLLVAVAMNGIEESNPDWYRRLFYDDELNRAPTMDEVRMYLGIRASEDEDKDKDEDEI